MKDYSFALDLLKESFYESYEKAGAAGFRYFHSIQVANIAKELARALRLNEEDTDVIVLASLLHDIAKRHRVQPDGLLKGSHDDEVQMKYGKHENQSAEEAKTILVGRRDKTLIDRVCATINNHDHPSTDLEKVLHDADELSEIGAMGVYKLFTYSAQAKRPIDATVAYWETGNRERIDTIVSNLQLNESKELAKKKIAAEESIIRQLANETGFSRL